MNTTNLFSCRLRKRDAESGFTLLEVMITIAIVAILLGLSVPSLRAYMENRYASSQAETLAGELRKSQIEAIKRNVTVELVMTTSSVLPVAGLDPNAATLTVGGSAQSSPVVNLMSRVAGGTTVDDRISGVSAGDDVNTASGATHARVSGVAGVGFNSFGKVMYTLDASNAKSNVAGNTVFKIVNPFYTATDSRRRCVFISPGGAVKVCDPAAASGLGAACAPALTTAECP